MRDLYVIILVATATLFTLTTADDNLEVGAPEGKLISTFQIVRFPNDACISSAATRNGTCYTSAECSDKGGTSSGSCADGFGVCCIFVVSACGQSSSENITYWEAPTTVPSGECNLKINPISDNICQLRLDFLTFVITGPSTSQQIATQVFAGTIPGGTANANVYSAANSGVGTPTGLGTTDVSEANWSTNCLTDSFSVSSPNRANHPPVICGINSGFHMYVDMDSDMGNTLSFIFLLVAGPVTTAANTKGVATLATRAWDMTLMQYECGYINSAPPGCTQYFWANSGAQVGGWLTSYNFQATGTKHLANQNQKMCIRREKGTCWAAFYLNGTTGTFNISGRTTPVAIQANVYTMAGFPCGYVGEASTGASNDVALAFDCVIIPGAFALAAGATGAPVAITSSATQVRTPLTVATTHSPFPPQMSGTGAFGGHAALDSTALALGDATAYTVFTQHEPFQLTFLSDGIEGQGGNSEGNLLAGSIGLKLSYDLISCVA